MTDELVRILLTIVFGALAGGVTNTIAIWMLFHPYEPPVLFGIRIGILQGAVPKNQARLAAAIGRTVGQRLLTEEDLAQVFAAEEFEAAFRARLSGFLGSLLEERRGALRDLLPPMVAPEIERLLREAARDGAVRLEAFVAGEEFEDWLGERADRMVESVREVPIGDLLTPGREEAAAAWLEEWLREGAESEGFRESLADYVERLSRRLLAPNVTFEEILPGSLVAAVEQGIQAYLPIAIERLGGLLEDPDARQRFERFIHDLLHRFLRDLRFHQRVVARLIVTETTIDRVLDAIEEEGAERLSEMLQDQAVQAAMAKGINDAIVEFMRRPVRDVLGSPDDPGVVEVRETVVDWLLNAARDPATRSFALDKLSSALDQLGARTLGDLVERVPRDRVAEWIASAARSEGASTLYRRAGDRLVDSLWEGEIGRPADWLPPDATRRIEEAVALPLWEWIQTQVPDVVRRIDVGRRVEEKVVAYPTEKLEELVRTVTRRELTVIVRLGYLLGAIIGAGLATLNVLIPG